MSHKFHGKASGKMKSEKRNKKYQEEMALQKMNSGDTPLNTAALLKEKQKTAQSPFVILSGGGQTFSTGTTISKQRK
ncbi:U4/U6.U5 tri-snRNP-associated protein 1 [Desmophyllum pertusum]|uniref:U4/U6.U5 tri-snRNP-associated protein 1 n=1 Tax=Desmophyllum pertusum TaxID=174260 RepID=A0A9W9YNL9_9CNID|nr:U4/U6.U5 tri-snRNP-associated protein 1 [Desmophyllum pertusum]